MENGTVSETKSSALKSKLSGVILALKRKPKVSITVLVVIVLLVVLFFAKGSFLAAKVNGSYITRSAVTKELEKQGGKQALEALITQKLIEESSQKQGVTVAPEEITAEIAKIEAQITGQGGTLKEALVAQGMTEVKLKEQITIQKSLEKLLASKTAVSEADIDTYIKDNKITPPKDVKLADVRAQIGNQLKSQKFQQEAQNWVAGLKASANITYYANY